MYDINTKIITKGYYFWFIFLAVGLLFFSILSGIFIFTCIHRSSLDSSVMSSSVEVNSYYDSDDVTRYKSTYFYIVDGEEYSCTSSVSSSYYPSTSNKKVYYNSKSPNKCDTSDSFNFFWLLLLAFLILPVVFIGLSVFNIKKINRRVKLVERLNNCGKLIKNLPYTLVNSGMSINDRQILCPVVDYILSSGVTVQLKGDPRFDYKSADADGFVDLVIDEANPDNYFIDFEINRLSGNLQSDYYVPNNNIINNDPYNTNYGFDSTNYVSNNINIANQDSKLNTYNDFK